jgi:hypothetical protein
VAGVFYDPPKPVSQFNTCSDDSECGGGGKASSQSAYGTADEDDCRVNCETFVDSVHVFLILNRLVGRPALRGTGHSGAFNQYLAINVPKIIFQDKTVTYRDSRLNTPFSMLIKGYFNLYYGFILPLKVFNTYAAKRTEHDWAVPCPDGSPGSSINPGKYRPAYSGPG